MSSKSNQKPRGALLSLPTFKDSDFNLLLDRQRIHIKWLLENGFTKDVGTLAIAGGMGEGYFLEDEEWKSLVDTLASEADSSVPTCVGVYEMSARAAAKKAQYAAGVGIDFIQLTPPHYLLPNEDEIFAHYKYVNDSAEIGIIAYNTPWAMPNPGYEFSRSLFERFSDLENIVGIKWSGFNVKHVLQMIRLFKERFNFLDNNRIFSHGARMGSVGFTEFYGNVAPRLTIKLWDLYKNKLYNELDQFELELEFDPEMKLMDSTKSPSRFMGEGTASNMILSAMGMDIGPPFPAQLRIEGETLNSYREFVQKSGLLKWVDWDQNIFN
tara:strand:- start:2471 stop:3445 length:975 start_codon:yes stop_codon:yes gene_type:complete